MTDAVFKACYAEWKVIKTRATVQLVFELPIERADEAYQALGGMPIAAHEVWCGIARLDPSKEHPLPPHPAAAAPRPASSAPQPLPAGENKQKRPFGEMSPAQQAGMLCHDLAFQKFLAEEHPDRWIELRAKNPREPLPDRAKAIVYQLCKVTSRAQIDADNAEWSALVLAYRLWQREPEFVS
jgi:hypothetical protein